MGLFTKKRRAAKSSKRFAFVIRRFKQSVSLLTVLLFQLSEGCWVSSTAKPRQVDAEQASV